MLLLGLFLLLKLFKEQEHRTSDIQDSSAAFGSTLEAVMPFGNGACGDPSSCKYTSTTEREGKALLSSYTICIV